MSSRRRKQSPRRPPAATAPAARASRDVSQGGTPLTDRLRPWLLGGMTALLVARPLFPSESAAQGDGLPVVMLWIALCIFWLLGAIGRKETEIRCGWTDLAVLALMVWQTIAGVWGAIHGSPRPAVNMLWQWIGLGLAFFLARQLVRGPRETRAVLAAMIALCVGLSAYGLYQYVYELPADQAAYEADPDAALLAAGIDYPAGSPERELFEARLRTARPSATFALSNSLAGLLAPWLVVLAGIGFGRLVGGDSSRRPDHGKTLIAGSGMSIAGSGTLIADRSRLLHLLGLLCCTLPMAICLLLTHSRSGCIAAGVGLLLLWRFRPRRTWRLGWKWLIGIVGCAAVAAAVALALSGAAREGLAKAATSLTYRVQYWQATWQMIADHPSLGCGPGNFQNAYTRYKLPEASEKVADPHNFLMEVWATAGTPALLALLAVLAGFGWSVWRRGGRGSLSARAAALAEKQPVPPADSPLFVGCGLVGGFLLAWPMGLLSVAPPRPAAILVGLPAALLALAALSPWIEGGKLGVRLPAIGLLVLLVNLLAAGGIGYPGIAGSFWLLLALGLNVAENAPRQQGRLAQTPEPSLGGVARSGSRRASRSLVFAGLILSAASAVLCYLTAYSPVLRCQGLLRAAEQDLLEGRIKEGKHRLLAAAAADPWSAEPWGHLATLAFETWQRKPEASTLAEFDQYVAAALLRDSSSAQNWLTVGNRYLEAFDRPDRKDPDRRAADLEKALAAYQRAVELYPNSGICHARLALAYRAAGKEPQFRREAEIALQLDDITPHADKKLRGLRDKLLEGLGDLGDQHP